MRLSQVHTRARIGTSKLKAPQKEDNPEENANANGVGSIVVIENVFHYKQVIPLKMGDNVIGRYMKGSKTNTPIETNDPSIDINHCTTCHRCSEESTHYMHCHRDVKTW